MKHLNVLCCMALGFTLIPGTCARATDGANASYVAAPYFTPHTAPGEQFGTVFSIARSIKGDGFDELVGRNGGAAVDTAISDRADTLTFSAIARYDGQPDLHGIDELSNHGKTDCFSGMCRTYTDASGLIYNELLWGKPPSTIKVGATWTVDIRQRWEMGPPAEQRITVVRIDPVARMVTLLREGQGTGLRLGESNQIPIKKDGKTYQVDVVPGPSHWKGYTTFRAGFVDSDELVVERPLILVSKELGKLKASEHMYMLLNAMPADSLLVPQHG